MSPDPTPDDPQPEPDGGAEQLAPREETESDRANVRGEHREDSESAWLTGYRSRTNRVTAAGGVGVSVHDPPPGITSNWRDYYKGFPLTRSSLRKFDEDVIEPGYTLRAVDPETGEQDDEMTEALQAWAEQCVIHAGETGQDLSVLLGKLPSRRRGRGTAFVEVAGTEDDPRAVAGLMLHDPSTFRIYTRENQTMLVQPDDDVPEGHPKTPDGRAAAYVQYDEALPNAATRFENKDEIAFAADEIVKLVYDADEGALWGTSVFESIGDRIDALIQKLEDRDTAIKTAGHPWRVLSSDRWTEEQAEKFARQHEKGAYSAYERGVERDPESFAGRIDFVPHDIVNIETHSGTVADIDDAVLDDVRLILSSLPVSRFRISHEESINQFVVEPQMDDDRQTVDRERRYLERKLLPLIGAKADELAGGEYDGEIEFGIRQPPEDNPLERENFDPERFKAVLDGLANYTRAGAEVAFPREFVMFLLGTDMEEFDEMFGNSLELDEQQLLEGGDLPEADEQAVQAAIDDEQTQDVPTPPELPDGEGGD